MLRSQLNSHHAHRRPWLKPAVLGDQFLQLTFFLDMILSFRLAYHEEDMLVTDGKRIAMRYLK